jgi:hypothetical protein
LVTDEIKNSSSELQISDENGYAVFKVDADGVKTTAIDLPKGDVQTQIDNIESSVDSLKNEVLENEKVTAGTYTDINDRLEIIESIFSETDDADNTINKWNEICDFIDSTEDTTLNGILSNYHTKDEVYTKDEVSETGIPSLVTDEIKNSSNELQISDDD